MADTTDDFDPKKAYETLSANIEQPDKFAKIFCDAASKQKSIDALLKGIIRDLLSHDQETKDCIKNLQREVDKEDWKFLLKKVGFAGWGVVMLFVGAIITAIVKSHF